MASCLCNAAGVHQTCFLLPQHLTCSRATSGWYSGEYRSCLQARNSRPAATTLARSSAKTATFLAERPPPPV